MAVTAIGLLKSALAASAPTSATQSAIEVRRKVFTEMLLSQESWIAKMQSSRRVFTGRNRGKRAAATDVPQAAQFNYGTIPYPNAQVLANLGKIDSRRVGGCAGGRPE